MVATLQQAQAGTEARDQQAAGVRADHESHEAAAREHEAKANVRPKAGQRIWTCTEADGSIMRF